MIANAKDSILAEGNSFAAPFDLERSGTIKGECLNKFLTAEQVGGAKFLHNLENPKITTKTEAKMSVPVHSLNVIMDCLTSLK